MLIRGWYLPQLFGNSWTATLQPIGKSVRENLPKRIQVASVFWSGVYKLFFILVWMIAAQKVTVLSGVEKGLQVALFFSILLLAIPLLMTFTLPVPIKRVAIEAGGELSALVICGAMLGAWL